MLLILIGVVFSGGYIDKFVVGVIVFVFNMFWVCNIYLEFDLVLCEYIDIGCWFILLIFIIICSCILFIVGKINGVIIVSFLIIL